MYRINSNLKNLLPNFGSVVEQRFCHFGPLKTYRARVKSGKIVEDPHQLEAVNRLEETYRSILGYNPSRKGPGRLFLSKWLTGNVTIESPKGLYIHGAVGGGKTMLMDLFYDTVVQTDKKRRVHFNSFMLDTHRRIHSLKNDNSSSNVWQIRSNRYDPIPPVADQIAGESWLICFDEFQVILHWILSKSQVLEVFQAKKFILNWF